MQLVVEATGVAHGLAVVITSPQGRGGCLAVGTRRARTTRRGLLLLVEEKRERKLTIY